MVLQEIRKIHQSHPQGASLSALQIECDVTVEGQVNSLVDTTVRQLGKLDVMIANAGIVKIAPLLDLSTEILDLTHSVNVKGVFYCYRAAARAMIPSGGGRIIGACSVGGKTTVPLFGAYCMSKSAVRSLTHTAAQEWAEYGITVNAYAPGPINTEMWLKNVISANDTGPILDQKATELSATHKKSTPEQVAGLVSFLLSPAADNMTGQCISIDGGWNMD
ncbi:Diacetyl reductase [(S)-acetoin forming] OS=Staphylococcus epidermidis (strain ATCC 35984 / RP62A) GN=butA PE=3 SV=1 [Rhizoctonia solani AG-1 IB]|uniref:Diacetyl reductase [(S)-acetoin forming] n=1 Tax=Thanatephorus cucumeris (strain AG1-IB / isolate 7/3/14) TaxID=1108050 RepID=A0A0B7FYL8_THACB|nr:Diacetyl reductase [(S)-acetoin forming] OS=Staphylococcus epidermidis (strain ATCC 35984 / RP62A) GN=butA PE=3 SV=1 [Rhizoctonia solani AG-1 IB]